MAKDKAPVVVVVEDDDVFRALLTDALEQLGYDVFAYRSAEALNLRLFHDVRPEMAIVDLMLPGLSGLHVCQMLAEARRAFGMKVLLTSNLGETELAQCAAAAGADGQVTKRKLLSDPAAALRELLPAPLLDAELVDEPGVPTAPATVGRAVRRHLQGFQPRVDVRVTCEIPVVGRMPDGKSFTALMADLSESGARLRPAPLQPLDVAPLAVDDLVHLTFPLERRGNVEADARVVWKRRKPDGAVDMLGLCFQVLPKPTREGIRGHLDRAVAALLQRK